MNWGILWREPVAAGPSIRRNQKESDGLTRGVSPATGRRIARLAPEREAVRGEPYGLICAGFAIYLERYRTRNAAD